MFYHQGSGTASQATPRGRHRIRAVPSSFAAAYSTAGGRRRRTGSACRMVAAFAAGFCTSATTLRWAAISGGTRLRRWFAGSRTGQGRRVETYVCTCEVCQHTKAEHVCPRCLLHSLPLPTRRGWVIGVDWLVGFPMTASGFDQVQVHVDHLSGSGKVHAVPTRSTDTAADAARIILEMALRSGDGVPDVLGITTPSSRAPCSGSSRGASARACSSVLRIIRTPTHGQSGSTGCLETLSGPLLMAARTIGTCVVVLNSGQPRLF